MTKSMTGFASATGAGAGFSWSWEIRSVNARGMDVRLRLPDWIEGLEAGLRTAIQKIVVRGNISLTLRVARDEAGQGVRVDPLALAGVLASIQQIQDVAASDHGLALAPANAADILSMCKLVGPASSDHDTGALLGALQSDFGDLLAALDDMRAYEGAALNLVLSGQLKLISELTDAASTAARARQDVAAQALRENLARVLENAERADADRVAQELAILTLKSDVTEEIDRLVAHVAAARELLAAGGPTGRKMDFLAQEFNREANTLCAKAQSIELTRIGLELKAVIEQMREQVQNVE